MLKKVRNVKLNVRPITINMAHKYYYEGPCRFQAGENLQPGFDQMVNGQMLQLVEMEYKFCMPEFVNMLDHVTLETSDDWEIKDEFFERFFADDDNVDIYYVTAFYGTANVFLELCDRAKKPIMMSPGQWTPMNTAAAINMGAEVIYATSWEKLRLKLTGMLVKKVLREANLLLINRFGTSIPIAGATDTFPDLRRVTEKFGIHFRAKNIHEFLDELEPLTPEGNYTTPGKQTPNITEEEIKELEAFADSLLGNAVEVEIEKDKLVKGLIVWKVIQKNMDLYDCMGMAITCPDACSTRRINKQQSMFCFAHSLNLEQGIPSACEYDVAAAVMMLVEIAISGKAPYMGNTMPLGKLPNGDIEWPWFIDEEEQKKLMEKTNLDNIYIVHHSTVHRKFHGLDTPDDPYAIRHFTYDQKFGPIFRYDFNADEGQVITLARFSGDLKRMMICRGEIVMGHGYHRQNCNSGFFFRVKDADKVFEVQLRSGIHIPLIYGDYVNELSAVAAALGLEAEVV